MQQPSLVYSHLQMPIVRLHWQHGMPLQVQQQEHRPSDSIRQRFCSVPVATSSSQRQKILQPSLVFSNFSVQRGTTHQLAAAGAPPGKSLGWNPPIGPPSGIAAEEDFSNRTDAALSNSFSVRPAARESKSGS